MRAVMMAQKNPYSGPLLSIHEVTGGCFIDMLAVNGFVASLFVGTTSFFHLSPVCLYAF